MASVCNMFLVFTKTFRWPTVFFRRACAIARLVMLPATSASSERSFSTMSLLSVSLAGWLAGWLAGCLSVFGAGLDK